jgi:hypothetical protein
MKKLEMVTFPSDNVSTHPKVGFWYDLQRADGTTVYRLSFESPIKYSVELPTGDDNQPLVRSAITNPENIFTILVPEISDAPVLIVFNSERNPDGSLRAAERILQTDLSKLIVPSEIPKMKASLIISFLNTAKDVREIEEKIKTLGSPEMVRKIAESIFRERVKTQNFQDLQELLSIKELDLTTFSNLVKILEHDRWDNDRGRIR